MRLHLICAVLIGLVSLPALAQQSPSGDVKQQISKVTERYAEAYNKRDSDGLASSFTQDGVYVAATGNLIKGPNEIGLLPVRMTPA